MAQTELAPPHKLTLTDRSALTVTGVSEVISLDDNAVLLQTGQGPLWIHGKQLRLKNLSPEGGQLVVSGKISALIYEDSRKKGGILSRFFG